MQEYTLTISDAAEILGKTRQGIYAAIKIHRLKAKKVGRIWKISYSELVEYQKTRYCRSRSIKSDGTLKYSKEDDRYSPVQLAKMCGCHVQRIYYLLIRGEIKYQVEGSNYIISIEKNKHLFTSGGKFSWIKIFP